MTIPNPDTLFDFMSVTVKEAGALTRTFFRTGIDVIRKQDESPVTEADLGAEKLIRNRIAGAFPDHGTLGEEFGATGNQALSWIIDPIDGTKSFLTGVPLYTTLLALVANGEPVCGAIYAPATDELCMAVKGAGCFYNGVPARVRPCKALSEATLLTTDYPHIYRRGFGKSWDKLAEKVRLQRTWGDAYGHMLVAAGRADIMFDPQLNIWDAAPLKVIMEEAGGAYFDTHGNPDIASGTGFSSSIALKPEILAFFS